MKLFFFQASDIFLSAAPQRAIQCCSLSAMYILAVLENGICECQRKARETFLFIADMLPGSIWLNQKLSVFVFLLDFT